MIPGGGLTKPLLSSVVWFGYLVDWKTEKMLIVGRLIATHWPTEKRPRCIYRVPMELKRSLDFAIALVYYLYFHNAYFYYLYF